MRPIFLLMALGWGGVALAGQPLSYEDAMRRASERAPDVIAAQHNVEKTDASVLGSRGEYDPQLQLTGGWNLSRGLQRFGGVGGVLQVNSHSWNTGLTLSQRTAIGTNISFSGRMNEQATDYTGSISIPGAASQARVASALNALGATSPSFAFSPVPIANTGGSGSSSTGGGGSSPISFTNYIPSFNLNIDQELLRGVRMANNLAQIRQAKEQHTLQELTLLRTRQQVLADTARAYWTWVYQDAMVQIRSDAEATAREALRVGAAKVEAGRAAPVERTRLEAALVQAQVDKLTATNASAAARDDLLVRIGEQPGLDYDPISAPGDVLAGAPDLKEATAAALTQSIDLQIAALNIENARNLLADTRHAVLPELILGIQGGLNGFSQAGWKEAFTLGSGMFPNIGISGTLNVPLANRAALGSRNSAAADVSRLQAVRDQAESDLRVQVSTQVRAIETARTSMELADANERLARETLAAEEARYEAGRNVLQDVLLARDQLATARGAAVKARTDYRIAIVDLQRLQGSLQD